MHEKSEIIEGVAEAQRKGAAFWSGFATERFFAKIGEAWSPAENVHHLIKSTRAVVKALAMPRLVLRLMFGTTRRESTSYEAVRDRYLALAKREAGRFGPSSQTEPDLDAWRARLLEQFAGIDRDLAAAIARWSEKDLDRYQLPHPLLGKLTVREMLFFTIYHHEHHRAGVERRLAL